MVLLGSTAVAADRPPVGPLKPLQGGHAPSLATVLPLLDDAALGGLVDASVLDAATGRVLLDRSASSMVIPASPLKILTAAAALSVLGPGRRLSTRVLATAVPSAGVLKGDLVLVGGGDPTLSAGRDRRYPQPAALDDLAARVAKAGIRSVTGRVVYDSSLFSGPALAEGWRGSYVLEGSVAPVSSLAVDEGRSLVNPLQGARSLSPAFDAADSFVQALRRAGVQVNGAFAPGDAPAGAKVIATVSSAPVRNLVERMLTESDNDLAEALGRLVALETSQPATFTGAASAVTDTLAKLGLPLPLGARLVDTSGLSREDRISPAYLASLVRLVSEPTHADLRAALTGLPVAAATGTLTKRFHGLAAAGAGVVRAKTGSLAGVSSLVGTAVTRGGRLLVFAVAAEAVPGRSAAEAALDRFAAGLANLA